MSETNNNIALIFGAGAKIGVAVTQKYLDNSYKVLTVSRSDSINVSKSSSHFHLKADLSDLSVVPKAFQKTKELFGDYPRVIVYNAYATNYPKPPTFEDAFDLTPQELEKYQSVNVTSAYSAIQESLKYFKQIKDDSKPKTFIYTGNIQNLQPFPGVFALGIGKSGAFSALEVAELLYGKKYGYRFYYADERTSDGGPAITGTDGDAAAEFYFDLAEHTHSEIPLEATFVPHKGYVKF